jgi:hypothetical protein
VPGIRETLAEAIASVMHALRQVDFYKRPGIAETLDWSRALLGLDIHELQPDIIEETAGCILKYHDDIQRLRALRAEKFLVGETGQSPTNGPS